MGSNLEKIKALAEEISSKEEMEKAEKKETVSCLVKIHEMLSKPRLNKKAIIEELKCLITKFS